MSWAPRLRGQHTNAHGPVEVKQGEIARSTGLAPQQFGKPYTPRTAGAGTDINALVRDGFERVVWVYRCVKVIAGNQARLPVEMLRGYGDAEEPLDDHILLPRLNMRANLSESAGFFRRRLSAQLLLSPRGAFAEMVRTNGGEIESITLLPPALTWAVPDPDKFVSAFQCRIGSKTYSIDPQNVLWFRNEHPTDPYRSMTPLEVCGIAVDTDFAASLLNMTFLRNNNQPGGIVGVQGLGMDSDAEELKAYFAAGARVGQWRVVDSEQISVVNMAGRLDEQYGELKKRTKEEISEGFGVPVSMIGSAADRTYANADAEVVDVFWGGTMPDHLDALADVFDLVDDDEQTHMRFNTDVVPALAAAKLAQREQERLDVAASIMAIDEARKPRGLDPLPDGLGELPRVSIATATIGATPPRAPGAAPAPAPAKPSAPAPAAKPPLEPSPEPGDGTGGTVAEPGKARQQQTKAAPSRDDLRQLAHWHLERQEGVVLAEMSRFFERQKRATLARMTGPKARTGTRHDRKLNGTATKTAKALDVDWIFQKAKWDAELTTTAAGFLAVVMGDAGQAVLDVFVNGQNLKANTPGEQLADVHVGFDVHDEKVTAAIGRRTARIVGANDTTLDSIRDEVAAGDAAGETIDELAARVGDVFAHAAGYRSEMIARTETGSAHNEAQLIAARDSGVVATKAWLTVGDDRVRDSHLAAEDDGDIGLDEMFSNGLSQPGDDSGDPEETINCRCVLTFGVSDATGGEGDTADEGE